MELKGKGKLFVAVATDALLNKIGVPLIGKMAVISDMAARLFRMGELQHLVGKVYPSDSAETKDGQKTNEPALAVGAMVDYGEVMAYGGEDPTRAPNAEDRLIQAIFGGRAVPAMTYDLRDPGVVTRAGVSDLPYYSCLDCGQGFAALAGETPFPCQCGGEIMEHDKAYGRYNVVEYDVLVTKPVGAGDRLVFPEAATDAVISAILPFSQMPRVGQRRVDLLLSPDHPLASGLSGAGNIHVKRSQFGQSQCGALLAERTTLRIEDKLSVCHMARRRYQVDWLPLPVDGFIRPAGVTAEDMTLLFAAGYRQTVAEINRLKVGDVQICETIIRGDPLPEPPILQTLWAVDATLRAMAVQPLYLTAGGGTKLLGELTTEVVTGIILKPMTTAEIRAQSSGEVTQAMTINYRTFKPERGGLFCERVFGPVKDWECYCGRYKGSQYKDKICDRCGVKVTRKEVRWRRFGHINLPKPVLHPLTRVKLEAIPVLPPGLRPMDRQPSGSWVTSDVNDLYRRLVSQANRLRKISEVGAPARVLDHGYRVLQEEVDRLFNNQAQKRPRVGAHNRRLISVSGSLKWQLDRLVNHPVGFSATGVAVPDATLAKNQIGLPFLLLAELFRSHVIREWVVLGEAEGSERPSIKQCGRLLWEDSMPDDDLFRLAFTNAIKSYPLVVLSEAHQAATLYPVLMEGEAIRLHPETAQQFGVAFTGDRVVIHLPLSEAAKEEARWLVPLDECPSRVIELSSEAFLSFVESGQPLSLTDLGRALLGL